MGEEYNFFNDLFGKFGNKYSPSGYTKNSVIQQYIDGFLTKEEFIKLMKEFDA